MPLFGSTKQNTVVDNVNQNTVNFEASTSVNVDTAPIAGAIVDAFDTGSKIANKLIDKFTNGASLAANSLSKGIGGAGANIGFGFGIIGLSFLLGRK